MKSNRLVFVILSLLSSNAFAITTTLPSSVDPSRVGQQLTMPLKQPKTQTLINGTQVKKTETSEIPGADKIRFVLKKITITGNTVFTYDELSPIFQADLNKNISLADLQQIVKNITLKYRDAGYVISRAILPAQTIDKGFVKIDIIEGYIKNTQVEGSTEKAKTLLNKYGDQLTKTGPLNVNKLERYTLLSNDIPGMKQVKTVLQPPQASNAPQGSTDVVFQPDFSKANGFISFDNRGTKYMGPNEYLAGAAINSIIQSGDQWGVQGLASSDWRELRYLNLYTTQPVGANGTTINLSGSISKTEPGYVLRPLKVAGDSREVVADVQTPWIRLRKQSLYTVFSFDYLNSQTDINAFNTNLYDDRIRSLRFATNYYMQDKWKGANQFGLQLSHGLSVLNASSDNQTNLSRIEGDPNYTKGDISLSRLQGITNKVTLYVAGLGQYAFDPLLSSEQFAFGGTQFGQAYDPAEITGDKGLEGKAELRYNAAPGFRYLSNLQYFTFYDIGKTWNIEPESINGLPEQESGASAGLGVRIGFNDYIYGAAEMAKPLTREVGTMNDKNPRYFLSITFTGKTKPTTDESSIFSSGAASNGPNAQAQAKINQK